MINIIDRIDNDGAASLRIKDMAADDRPREKALLNGIDTLSKAELMAILFGTGIKGMSVVDLCKVILSDNDNNLHRISRMSPQELTARYKGIGQAKAVTLLAALTLGKHLVHDRVAFEDKPISNADLAASYMRHRLDNVDHEQFWVLYLSQRGTPIKDVQISRGGLNATMVDVRVILKHALLCNATSMILFHNHPSGNLRPSAQDDALTKKIKDAASQLDLRVNDHIIMSYNGHYSYMNEGRMP